MPQATPATYLKLLLTALFWGGTWVAGRVAVQEAAPFAVASWRFFVAALVLGVLLIVREGWLRWSARQWLKLAALGLSGVFFYNVFFLYGLQRVEAGRGALVVALTPAMIALADWLLFRLPMSPKKVLGIVLALFGSLLVVTRGQPRQLLGGGVGLGEWLLMGSVVSWASYTLINRHFSKQFSALALAFGGCFTGWLMLTATALINGSLFVLGATTWRGWSSIIFLGLFGTALAFTWYSEGIARIGTTKSAAFINLVPVFAVLLGTLMLDEWLGGAVLAGGALVIVGVFLTNRTALPATT
ncbi:DMT family transporter [Propionivibrio sp.]|uniref:DMT family transporter n=1 Tax=Propionivibrio sp. TaxID=2212460 RepID=UPI0026299413|nr:DMT family transporter [Propionivibrio sp.]